MDGLVYVGAGLAIGLAVLGVSLWQWMLARVSVDILWKNPKLMSTLRIYTIIGIALVESSAIYGLLMAMKILWTTWLDWLQAVWAGLAIWLTAFGAGYGEGKLVAWALEAVNRNPENKATVLQFMMLFAAMIEAGAIYGLLVTMNILGK